jgi:hypothetical protein
MSATKIFLCVIGVLFVALQAYWTFAPQTGILDRYGFFEGFPAYFELHVGNSLLMAGLTDFVLISAISFIWMYSDTPRERLWKPKFFIWIISFIVFPGLGFLVYFLFLNPDHRFVAKRPSAH